MSADTTDHDEHQTGVCGWDAEQAREYREFALVQEIREFAALYGWTETWALVRGAIIQTAAMQEGNHASN